MKKGMIMKELVIPEVSAELMDTTHLLTQKEIFMHWKIPQASQRCLLLDKKEGNKR
jgi:hypothetical protein